MQKAGVLGVSGRSPDASGTGFFAFMICYPVEALKSICVECFTEFPYKDAGCTCLPKARSGPIPASLTVPPGNLN
jgi:hypothetical protein